MLNEETRNIKPKSPFLDSILAKKISAPVIILLLVLASLSASYIIAREGYEFGLIILCVIIGLPAAWATIVYPKFGIITLIIASFFINYVSRFLPEEMPIGLVMDALTYLLIIGFFVKQKQENNWSYFDNPISYFILVWLGYNLLEIINPSSPSIWEWVYTVRTVGFLMLMYFVFVFHIRTKSFLRLLLKLWLVLEFLSGLAALQQEHFGLLPFEHDWLFREPLRFKLLF
ncbi:MAG: hypothetical protein JWQ84_2086, partial [Mucilaginibacter sp.]|nr:hypothetical protein [Mucilaginibacter sp.]